MKKATRLALFSSPAFFLALLSLIWIYVAKPYVLELTKKTILSLNQKQNFVDVKFDQVDLSLLKLQMSIKDLSVSAQESHPEKLPLKPIHVGLLRFQVDPFSLAVGQFSLSQIVISNLQTEQNLTELKKMIKKDNKNDDKIDLSHFFEILENLPLQKASLTNSHIYLEIDEEFAPHVKKLNADIIALDINFKRNSLKIDLNDLLLKIYNEQHIEQSLKVSSDLKLDAQSFEIVNLKVLHGGSFIQLKSKVKNLPEAFIKPQTLSELKVELKLDEIKDFLYFIKEHKKRIPLLTGLLKFKGQFATESLTENKGEFELITEEIRFENIKLGNARALAQLKNNQIKLNSLKLEHPSGTALVKDINISQKKPFDFSAQIQVEQFDLQKLFISLGLKDIPAFVQVKGNAECTGRIEYFEVDCQTQINADHIVVLPEINSKFNIIKLQTAAASGSAHLDTEGVTFKTKINLPRSAATGEGTVSFEKGFKMNFSSEGFDLNDIEDIAGLGLKGVIQGELKTEGTSSWGKINAKIKSKSFVISEFRIGDVNSDLRYEKGHLSFNSVQGNLNQTKYVGDLDINLIQNTIDGQLSAPTLQSEDIIYALPQSWNFDLDTVGTGQAQIKLDGPLDFWKLKYRLKSQFKRIQVLGENFSNSDVELEATGDEIIFKNVIFRKPTSSLRLTQSINTKNAKDPQFNLQVNSDQLRLEDSDHLSQIFNNLTGQLLINGTVTGPITEPQVNLKTVTRSSSLDSQAMANSQGDLNLNKKYMYFDGQILGRQVQTQLKIPFSKSENYVIKAQLKDFNPFIMLPLIKLPLPPSDSSASVTGDINLISKNQNINEIMGSVEIENIFLQRNTQTLKLVKPAKLEFDTKLKSMTPLELKGAEQNLKIYLKSPHKLALSGRLFLRPLQFLVPFAENLSGILEFSAVSNIEDNKFNLAGEGLIDTGSMSFKGFKYPINDINSYFDFNQSKIIISDISATLNQTPITGSGQVDIQGPKNVIVNLAAETEKLDIEFPPQYQTSGYAKIQFFGNWLPYTLKMNYLIDQGNITKEFTEDTESSVIVRPSPLLPTQQKEAKNETLKLDVTADFNKGLIVKNSILEGIVTGSLKIKGTPEIPLIEGKVDIQQGSRLIFKDKPFEVQNGFVNFDGDYLINPQIQITSNARITDYDINLSVQGRAKSLDIKTSSQPYLSREDIISLLALGYISSKGDQTLSSDAQQQQTGLEVLAALSNQSKLNKKLEQKLGLNVQLAPSIDSTRNIAVPKVIVSKKLNKKVTTSYSRPLTGDRQENEVRLQYLLQKNLSVILNYQNQSTQQNSIIDNKKTDDGIGGIDLEFKKEFD